MLDSPSRAESFGSTSSSLLARARSRDPAAWQRLVQLYSPLVYHWCRRSRLPPQDSADLLQEVFQSVSTAIDRFRYREPGHSFRGWLRVITQNKLRDHFRDRNSTPEATGGSDAQQDLLNLPEIRLGDGDAAQQEEQRLLFRRGLQLIALEFEDTTWQAFWRVTIQGQQPGHVAADLGLSLNACYKAKARVLARLREQLEDDLE
jgi:RNA polymerase sigma-70 factor, ECF subfamily